MYFIAELRSKVYESIIIHALVSYLELNVSKLKIEVHGPQTKQELYCLDIL